MSLRRNTCVVAALGAFALLPACNPYQNFDGEFFAGPIDPTNFQDPYVGQLPGTADQSGGVIVPNTAFVNGAETFYYLFPFGDNELTAAAGPLTISVDSGDMEGPNLAIPNAYIFDPSPATGEAFITPGKCKAPANYVFDQRLEAYRRDEQGTIFSLLPSSAAYFPIVQEIPVTSNGEACQDIKSKAAVTSKRQDITVGAPDGNYLAIAVIDPGADVQPNLANGLGPIHLGFYNHFLVAFIDGGYIPTVSVAEDPAAMTPAHTDFKTQRVFFPLHVPTEMTDDMGVTTVVTGDGALGGGFDILDAARGDSAYSPICEVWAYEPDTVVDPADPTMMAMLPDPKTSVTDLSNTEMASAAPTGDLVYCFQVF